MALSSIPIPDYQEIGDSLPVLNSSFLSLDTRFELASSNFKVNIESLSSLQTNINNVSSTSVASITSLSALFVQNVDALSSLTQSLCSLSSFFVSNIASLSVALSSFNSLFNPNKELYDDLNHTHSFLEVSYGSSTLETILDTKSSLTHTHSQTSIVDFYKTPTTILTASNLSGIVNFDAKNQTILYSTLSSSGPLYLNIIGNSTTPLSSMLNVGESVKLNFIHTTNPTSKIVTFNNPTTISYLSADNMSNFWLDNIPFTIETWIKPEFNQNFDIVGRWQNPALSQDEWNFHYNVNPDKFRFVFRSGPSQADITTLDFSYSVVPNVWSHIAISKDSNGDWRMFVDGTQIGSTIRNTASMVFSLSSDGVQRFKYLDIGGAATVNNWQGGGYLFQGHMSNMRIVKGQAIYTSNFPAPTQPLTLVSQGAVPSNVALLTFQDTDPLSDAESPKTFISSTNSFPISSTVSPFDASFNNGSVYFNGTNRLQIPNNADITLGRKNFVVEAWVNPTAVNTTSTIVGRWNAPNTAGTNEWLLNLIQGSPTFNISTNGASVAATPSGPVITANSWSHIAAVRSGNNFRVFSNGVGGTVTNNSESLYYDAPTPPTPYDPVPLSIGYTRANAANHASLSNLFPGSMFNLRIIKNQNLYQVNDFVSPTTKLKTFANGGATPSVLPTPTNTNVVLLALQTELATTEESRTPKTLTKGGSLPDGSLLTSTKTYSLSTTPTLSLIAAGSACSFYVNHDLNRVYILGTNLQNQLGVPAVTTFTSDWLEHSLRDVREIKSSYTSNVSVGKTGFTFFMKKDGTVWGTGTNTDGQLGDGTTVNKTTPTLALAVRDVISVACGGSHSLFLRGDGSAWATGLNANGQLGDATTVSKSTPFQVMTGVVAIAAGQSHSLFLKSDGTVQAAGLNTNGQLGDNTTTQRPTPVQVMTGVTAIAAGQFHSVFLKSDGSVWATGLNTFGQLGDGTVVQKNAPVQVMSGRGIAVACGANHSLFLLNNGTVVAVGQNATFGQLGRDTTTDASTPGVVLTSVTSTLETLSGVVAMAPGSDHTLLLMENGSILACGNNRNNAWSTSTIANPKRPNEARPASSVSPLAVYENLYQYNFATNQYLQSANNTEFTTGTGDFTVECWWKSPVTFGTSGNQYIWTIGRVDSTNAGLRLDCPFNGNLRLFSANTTLGTSTISHTTNTWYHLAVVRSGTTLRLYINGAVAISITNSTSFITATVNGFIIGADFQAAVINSAQAHSFYGVRYVKQALYTNNTNFSVPSTPFQTTSQGALNKNVALHALNNVLPFSDYSINPKNLIKGGTGLTISTQPASFGVDNVYGLSGIMIDGISQNINILWENGTSFPTTNNERMYSWNFNISKMGTIEYFIQGSYTTYVLPYYALQY